MTSLISPHNLLKLFSFPPNTNPNYKPKPNQFQPLNYSSNSFSTSFPLKSSSLDFAPINEPLSDAHFRTPATLRELCQGHVPDHVLNRFDFLNFFFIGKIELNSVSVSFSFRLYLYPSQIYRPYLTLVIDDTVY